MIKTLNYAWRFLMRFKSYTFINIIGLALSLACAIMLLRYIHQETQVNSHCIDAKNVYIPIRDIDGNIFPGNISGAYRGANLNYYTEEAIKEKAHFLTFNNDNININDRTYTVQLLVADTAFFHFFTYPLTGTQMKMPTDALITRQFAKRVFGEENPIGKKLDYSGGYILTVCGILDEPACKSSLTFDIVFNYELKNSDRGWERMWVELLRFMPGIDVDAINANSNVYRQADAGYQIRFDFVPVSELYWNKALAAKGHEPEMWHFSSRFHLWILSSVCLLILIAGILNFINIYMVFMLKRSKEYGIKKVFGIGRSNLFVQLWAENVLMVIISLFLAWFFIEMFSGYANQLLESNVTYTSFDWQLSLGVLIFLPLLTTVYPYLKYNYLPPIVSIRTIGASRYSVKIRTIFLFVQYSITLLLIILSLYFSNHLHFLLHTPPGFRTQGILYADLMPQLPINWWENSQEVRGKLFQNMDAMKQKLNECPYIEKWFPGEISSEGILSTGTMATMINDKDVKLSMNMMWVPTEFFEIYGLRMVKGILPTETDRQTRYGIIMNETALKAFGYTRQEEAFVKGESALWISSSPEGERIEDGLSLMPVQGVVKDYYAGHLTGGKKPIIYMVSGPGINVQCQIACVPGKEKLLVEYLRKSKEEIFGTDEFTYRWLEDDIKALYRDDRRVTIVFTLFAAISIFVSVLGLFGLSLFDIRQRYREIGIRKVNGARLRNLYAILLRKYVWIILGAALLTMPLSYYLIYTYTADFVVKAPISISIFIIALFIVLFISLGTLLWQVNKAARVNPADVIKTE